MITGQRSSWLELLTLAVTEEGSPEVVCPRLMSPTMWSGTVTEQYEAVGGEKWAIKNGQPCPTSRAVIDLYAVLCGDLTIAIALARNARY